MNLKTTGPKLRNINQLLHFKKMALIRFPKISLCPRHYLEENYSSSVTLIEYIIPHTPNIGIHLSSDQITQSSIQPALLKRTFLHNALLFHEGHYSFLKLFPGKSGCRAVNGKRRIFFLLRILMIYYTCPPFDFCTKSCKMGSNFNLSRGMGPTTKV